MAIEPGVRMHSGEELTAPAAVTTITPLTGATVALPAGTALVWVNPAGTIATLTVLLPPNPKANQRVGMSFSQIVTALTVQDSAGNAVTSTAGAIGAEASWRFIGGAWVLYD
jgi:hypothetical protein